MLSKSLDIFLASTLWLNDYLGDGTYTVMIIFIAMIAIPLIIKKVRNYNR